MADIVTGMLPIEAVPDAKSLAEQDFNQIVRLHQRRIYRILLCVLKDPDAADNLTQECFLRAYRKRASFRGEAAVETWLTRIAINLTRDYFRSKRRGFWQKLFHAPDRQELSDIAEQIPDGKLSSEAQLVERERVAAIWKAANRLSPNQREVFLLRFAEDMTLQEIAATLDVEIGTVKAHLSRALSGIRTRLKGAGQ
ncbi:MAG TPA: sigma-70 family RNA polymerase sigma factor [Terriglobales bacterium]|nr:sigma-70 family RNA polymerase sigma factor [Terriglobales bacterium]